MVANEEIEEFREIDDKDLPNIPRGVVIFTGDIPSEQFNAQDILIWRYLDFPKFVSLLQTRSLYLARADRFDDPFEGSLSLSDKVKRDYLLSLAPRNADVAPLVPKIVPTLKKKTFIQCWHISDHESVAMWKIYSGQGKGIAIGTNVKRLVHAITSPEIKINVGPVRYIDYETGEVSPDFNDLTLFITKRREFSYEKEFRIVVQDSPQFEDVSLPEEAFKTEWMLPVNLDHLLQEVYLSPNSPAWYLDVLKDVLSKYKLSGVPIQKSSLDRLAYH